MIKLPITRKLTYRERNLINVLSRTSVFQYSEVESLYKRTGSVDVCILIMDDAAGSGKSLEDAMQMVLVVQHMDGTDPEA